MVGSTVFVLLELLEQIDDAIIISSFEWSLCDFNNDLLILFLIPYR